MSVTLQTDAAFRLGIISDVTDAHVSPTAFNLEHTGTSTNLTVSTMPYDLAVDYYFFDITGNAGDVFTLTGQNDLIHPGNGIAGIFFDSYDVAEVPEPATMILFGTGLAGLVGLRQKKRRKEQS